MLSFTHLALLPLALTSLSLALASPASPISAPANVPAAAAEHDSILASRTFGWSSGGHHQSIWDKGGWWSQNDCRDASKSAICFSRGFGWGCNSQCICIQPPNHDGCKDEGRWKHCQSKGHGWGCSKSCECVPPPSDEPECKSSLVESCSRQGKGANKSCQCECRPWIKFFCQKKGGWLSDDCKCNLPTSKPKHYRRSLIQAKRGVCPMELSACAIDPSAKRPLFECIDTTSTLDSCGGCSSEGTGVDCSQIEGAEDVSCEVGRCVVRQCAKGWAVSGDEGSCERQQEGERNETYWGGVFRNVRAGSRVVMQ